MKKIIKYILAVSLMLGMVITITGCGKKMNKDAKEYDKDNEIVSNQTENNNTDENNDIEENNIIGVVDDKQESNQTTSGNEGKENNNTKDESTKSESKKDKAVQAIKVALKDKEWVKNNLYFTKDELDDNANSQQVVNFIVCKSSSTPIVVVEVDSEEAKRSKVVLVSYINGEVKAEFINSGHIYHGGYSVDANKGIVREDYMHAGSYATMLHSVSTGSVKFIGGYGNNESGTESGRYTIFGNSISEQNEVSEAEYNKCKASLNVDQYKFVEIGTSLTNANVDKYIK